VKRNVQLHLYVLFSILNKIMSFSVGWLYKQSFEKWEDRTQTCVVYRCSYLKSLMLKSEKFDVEMTECSGITGIES